MNPIFLPIALCAPDPSEVDRIRKSIASGVDGEIEICCDLSSAPVRLWHALFPRAWRQWFPDMLPPYTAGKTLMIKSTRAQFPSRFEMAKFIVRIANEMCGPVSKGQEAQAIADRKRRAVTEQLSNEHAKPVMLPDTRDRGALLQMLDRKQFNDRKKAATELALAEFDNAILELGGAELADAMSRIKGN
jgi:hypothetical protein